MNQYRQTQIMLAVLFCCAATLSQRGWAAGGIITDGTVGGKGTLHNPQILVPTIKNEINISENYGTRRGGNLFHSFKDFNINRGQTVTFREKTPNSTNNVISRVTGASGSDINGTLQVTPGGKANFYLINPNGITFGPGGQVDVPGSIHLSTADQIKLKDGKIFSAVNPQPVANSLSSASPSMFGFLGSSVKNNGLLKIDSASFDFDQKKSIDIVAGQIQITGSPSDLFAPSVFNLKKGGEVRLIAIKGRAEISLNPTKNGLLPLPNLKPTGSNAGKIEFNQAPIEITENGAGKLSIWGGAVNLTVTTITITNTGAINPGQEKGITIQANSVELFNGSNISSNTNSSNNNQDIIGKSADITINTTESFTLNNSALSAKSAERNNSGNIDIKTGGDLIVDGQAAKISTEMQSTGSGKGGDIQIHTLGDIKLINGGRIGVPFGASSSSSFDGGIGNIRLKAEGNLILNGKFTGIFALTTSAAKAGDIDINVKGNIFMHNDSEINSGTRVNDSSANIRSGDSGSIKIVATNIYMNNSSIHAESEHINAGNPGNINIAVLEDLNLNNHSRISLQNKSEQAEDTVSSQPFLSISAPDIRLNRSQITTQSSGNQPAGSIDLICKNKLSLESSEISTKSQEGNGGNIDVTADNLVMATGWIQANTAAQNAKGGNIDLNLKSLLTSGNQLIVGGSKPVEWRPAIFGLNVIQAAAPNGLSGSINNSAPVLNLSGTLANLGNPQYYTSVLNWENCLSNSASSLIRSSNGGIPIKARDSWVY